MNQLVYMYLKMKVLRNLQINDPMFGQKIRGLLEGYKIHFKLVCVCVCVCIYIYIYTFQAKKKKAFIGLNQKSKL